MLNCAGSLICKVHSCFSATQYILLSAHAPDPGAVKPGVQSREAHSTEIAAFFKLPAHSIPIASNAVGHPIDAHPPATA